MSAQKFRPVVLENDNCVFFPYAEAVDSEMNAKERHEYTEKAVIAVTGYKVDVSPYQRRREDKAEITFVPGVYVDYDLVSVKNV